MASADKKQDSPGVLRKTSDQVTQEMDKKVVFPSSVTDSPAQGNDQVSPPSQTAVDEPDHVKTRLVPASVVSEFGEWSWVHRFPKGKRPFQGVERSEVLVDGIDGGIGNHN